MFGLIASAFRLSLCLGRIFVLLPMGEETTMTKWRHPGIYRYIDRPQWTNTVKWNRVKKSRNLTYFDKNYHEHKLSCIIATSTQRQTQSQTLAIVVCICSVLPYYLLLTSLSIDLLRTSLTTYLPTSQSTYLPTYLPTYPLLTSQSASLSTYLLSPGCQGNTFACYFEPLSDCFLTKEIIANAWTTDGSDRMDAPPLSQIKYLHLLRFPIKEGICKMCGDDWTGT